MLKICLDFADVFAATLLLFLIFKDYATIHIEHPLRPYYSEKIKFNGVHSSAGKADLT